MKNKQELDYISETLCHTDDTFWLLFNSLGHCTRYRMAKVMLRYRKMSVTDLAQVTNISVPAASQHLKLLEKSGLVGKKRVGKTVLYELREDDLFVDKLMQIIDLWVTRKEQDGLSTAA